MSNGSENDRADYLSKVVEKDNYGLSFELLDLIVQKREESQVDWFTSDHNVKLSTVYSKFWNKNSAVVDSFTFQLSDGFEVLLCPQSVFYTEFY